MSAAVLNLRAARATRSLVVAGWDREAATLFVGVLESMPTSLAAFAHARRVLRSVQGARQTRAWLVQVGYIETEACAFCERPIRARACSVVLRARRYCNESCCLEAVDAERAS